MRLSATALVAMGAMFFSLMGLCVKKTHVYAHPTTFSLQVVRNSVGLLLNCGAMVVGRGQQDSSLVPRSKCAGIWLAVRSFGGFACVTLEYMSLQQLPLAVNSMIVYSSPAFIVIWAAVLLGEKIQLPVILCLATCFAGLLLIVEPWRHSTESAPSWAYAAALGAAASAGLVYVALRELKEVCYHTVLTAFMVTALALSLFLGSILDELSFPPLSPSPSRAWIWLLGVAATCYAAEVCITLGFARAQKRLGQVSVLKFLSPILSILWGVVFLGEEPAIHVLAGAALVLGASAYIVYGRSNGAHVCAAAGKDQSQEDGSSEEEDGTISTSCSSSSSISADETTELEQMGSPSGSSPRMGSLSSSSLRS